MAKKSPKRSDRKAKQANAPKPQWQAFEEMVADLQRELSSPSAIITVNDKIVGKLSGRTRQIDVSIREKVAQFDILVVVEAKLYKRRIDIKRVEEFKGLADDVGANKAAMVSVMGYSQGAKSRAKQAGIDLLRPLDSSGTQPWTVLVKVPVICNVLFIDKFNFTFSGNDPRFSLGGPLDLQTLMVTSKNGDPQGTLLQLLQNQWHSGAVPLEPGFQKVPLGERPTFIPNAYGEPCQVNLEAGLHIGVMHYLGEVELKEVRGMANETTGSAVIKRLTTDSIEFEHIQKNWKRLDSLDQLAIIPAFVMEAAAEIALPNPSDPPSEHMKVRI